MALTILQRLRALFDRLANQVRVLKRNSNELRWQMLVIFAFFSILSTTLLGVLAIALVNVVVRRETAYVLEEHLKYAVGSNDGLCPFLKSQRGPLALGNWDPPLEKDNIDQKYTVDCSGSIQGSPIWLKGDSFSGIVVQSGKLEIRFYGRIAHQGCSQVLNARLPLNRNLLGELSNQTGLQLVDSEPIQLLLY